MVGGGFVSHWDGASWANVAFAGGTGLWGNSGSNVFAVANYDKSGTVAHYDGASWKVQSKTAMSLNAIWGSSGSNIFAVGGDEVSYAKGMIQHYDGSSWQDMKATAGYLHGVWGSSSSDVVAIGKEGTIMHYDGSTWSPSRADLRQPPAYSKCTELNGIGGAGPVNGLIVGERETILRYCPNGLCPSP